MEGQLKARLRREILVSIRKDRVRMAKDRMRRRRHPVKRRRMATWSQRTKTTPESSWGKVVRAKKAALVHNSDTATGHDH